MTTERTRGARGRTMSGGARAAMRLATAMHSAVYRRTGGRVGGKFRGGAPVLLLDTIGHRTGKRRTTPLLYLADGEDFVIVASAGGAAEHPAWWLNLLSNPEATVRVGREVIPVRAEEARGEERGRLWERLLEMYPGYAGYQEATTREIPVARLRRVPGPQAR